ncbi:MAG: hypothetical protein QW478_06475 [Candidatus Micrarchaeaceae archaeon]
MIPNKKVLELKLKLERQLATAMYPPLALPQKLVGAYGRETGQGVSVICLSGKIFKALYFVLKTIYTALKSIYRINIKNYLSFKYISYIAISYISYTN